jgi:hypothetical protein
MATTMPSLMGAFTELLSGAGHAEPAGSIACAARICAAGPVNYGVSRSSMRGNGMVGPDSQEAPLAIERDGPQT